jgi:hypothetical protein
MSEPDAGSSFVLRYLYFIATKPKPRNMFDISWDLLDNIGIIFFELSVPLIELIMANISNMVR